MSSPAGALLNCERLGGVEVAIQLLTLSMTMDKTSPQHIDPKNNPITNRFTPFFTIVIQKLLKLDFQSLRYRDQDVPEEVSNPAPVSLRSSVITQVQLWSMRCLLIPLTSTHTQLKQWHGPKEPFPVRRWFKLIQKANYSPKRQLFSLSAELMTRIGALPI